MRALALVALMALGCGTVTADPKDGAAGAGGAQAAAGASGAAGDVGQLGGRGGVGGELGGQAGQSAAGAGGRSCVDANALGFAFNRNAGNGACPQGGVSDACYPECTLNGVQYVGCVTGSDVANHCVSSCATCP